MSDRSNVRLNEEIERWVDTWDGTVIGACVKNMYENGDSYEHICEATDIDIDDFDEE